MEQIKISTCGTCIRLAAAFGASFSPVYFESVLTDEGLSTWRAPHHQHTDHSQRSQPLFPHFHPIMVFVIWRYLNIPQYVSTTEVQDRKKTEDRNSSESVWFISLTLLNQFKHCHDNHKKIL
jgi:hypothetical protein